MMMTVRFSRDDEEDDLDAERVVFAPLKRTAATAASAADGGNTRVRIKDVMVGVQNVFVPRDDAKICEEVQDETQKRMMVLKLTDIFRITPEDSQKARLLLQIPERVFRAFLGHARLEVDVK